MSNIHITLVGGQTTPVYQGIVAANPEKVILVYSGQTEMEANRIYAEIKVDCELCRFDPVNLPKINESIYKLKNSLKETDQVSVNVSGGTKPWSLLFYGLFKDEPNATVFVIDQNNQLWNLKTQEQKEVVFDIDVQFRLSGNELKQYRKIEEFTEADRVLIKEIRELRSFNFQDFNTITEILYRFPNETEAKGKGNSTLKWNTVDKSYECTMRNRQGQELSKVLRSEHVRDIVLNTGWFELEVALMLAGWNKTRKLRMNCIFPAKSGSPKNEIDIIINTDTKLLFVECKTQIKNETDIDKFASAVRNYGGLGSKALFVTNAPMNEKALEKCREHDIMTFSMQNKLWGDSALKLLYEMLNRELLNINPK